MVAANITGISATRDRSVLSRLAPRDMVSHVEVTISHNDINTGAAEVLAAIRPHWDLQDVKYELFTDGITNKLVCCSLGGDRSPDKVVLVRVYGQDTDLLIDRQAEIRNITTLQRTGFAPALYATFENGLAYEFVPGDTLTVDSVRSDAVFPLVARRMAELHRTEPPQGPNAKPILWNTLRKYLGLVSASTMQRLNEKFGCAVHLEEELESLERELSSLGSPVVMCHNDLLLANVIYSADSSSVTFIDYEYAGPNYQAFDIGNHFAEFAGVSTVDYSLYPGKALQKKWLKIYLEDMAKFETIRNDGKGLEEDVEKLYVEVNKFTLASHFLWGLWALVQSEHSAIKFDFFVYAEIRLKEYFSRKDEFLSLHVES